MSEQQQTTATTVPTPEAPANGQPPAAGAPATVVAYASDGSKIDLSGPDAVITPPAVTQGKPEPRPALDKMFRVPKGVMCLGKIVDTDAAPEMRGVRVERTRDGDCRADVTDGVRAITVRWQDEHLLPAVAHACVIPGELAVLAERAIPTDADPATQLVEAYVTDAAPDFELTVRGGAGGEDSVTVAGKAIDCRFPAIDDVAPDYRPARPEWDVAAAAKVNVKRLIGLLEVLKKCGVAAVQVDVPTGGDQPVVFTGYSEDTGHEVRGLLVPLNSAAGAGGAGGTAKKDDAPMLPGLEATAPAPAAPAGDPDAWRAVALSYVWNEVGADAKLLDLLADGKVKRTGQPAEIRTLGQLAAFTGDGHARLTDIAGVGPAKAEAIEDATLKWYARHPQQAQAPVAAGNRDRNIPKDIPADAAPSTAQASPGGLAWTLDGDEMWAANTAGFTQEDDGAPATFVVSRTSPEGTEQFEIDGSHSDLLPLGPTPGPFATADEGKAWCESRDRSLRAVGAGRPAIHDLDEFNPNAAPGDLEAACEAHLLPKLGAGMVPEIRTMVIGMTDDGHGDAVEREFVVTLPPVGTGDDVYACRGLFPAGTEVAAEPGNPHAGGRVVHQGSEYVIGGSRHTLLVRDPGAPVKPGPAPEPAAEDAEKPAKGRRSKRVKAAV